MQYIDLVRKTYQEAIALKTDIPSDLRTALRAHERMPLLFQNLALEIERAQDLQNRKGKAHYSDKTIKGLIYDVIDIFIAGVVSEATRRYETDAEKYLRFKEEKEAQDLKDTAAGNPTGDYKDIFDDGEIKMTDERSDV